ncbi:32858_t:CDS:2, partial [Racocetra persica]
KDSKFVREETTAPLGLTIIPSTFISNIKNNACLSNKKSITIPTEVLIEKSNPKTPNYILLEDAFVRTTLRIKDLNESG